jgi:hypothetical protein
VNVVEIKIRTQSVKGRPEGQDVFSEEVAGRPVISIE